MPRPMPGRSQESLRFHRFYGFILVHAYGLHYTPTESLVSAPEIHTPQKNLGPSNNHQQLETLTSTPELKEVGYYRPKVLDRMRCPISLMIMDDPVHIDDFPQHAFERSYLVEWLKRNKTNPLTGKPADPTKIKSADRLKRDITLFLSLQTKRKQWHEQTSQENKLRYEPKPLLFNQYQQSIQAARTLKDQATPTPDNPKQGASFKRSLIFKYVL